MIRTNVTSVIDTRALFVILSLTIVALIVDTSIVKIYRLITPIFSEWDIATFIVIAIVYSIAQYILLRNAKRISESSRHFAPIQKIVALMQFVLIGLIVTVILQMIIISGYSAAIVVVAIAASYSLAISMTGLLAIRFYSWFRSNRNIVVLAYCIAAVAISVNAAFTLVYVSFGLLGVSGVVHPHIGHVTVFGQYSSLLNSGYVLSSIVSFTAMWLATILLLQHHSKKLGKLKFAILVSIPLAYFLIQFQPLILEIFSAYRTFDPVLFNIVYTMIFSLSKPVGGILFGIAFWVLARNIRHKTLRDYLIVAGIGLILLFTSNQATVLINLPYPPFGMATISFMGMSAYLVLLGIYFSAVSVAQDMNLRRSIRNSVERQFNLLDNIGMAEVQKEMERRVITLTKDLSAEIEHQTGVQPSLEGNELKDYVAQVIEETRSSREVKK